MKTLVIAEKPSVAKDIVRALTPSTGRFMDHGEHHENDTYIVTSAVGHLVEIYVDEKSDPKKSRWNLKSLPVIPEVFDLRPIDRTKARLMSVAKLIQRKDVTVLINACDAGREGELIFRLIVDFASQKKPVNKIIKRLWLQSMTPQAILDGFANLRTDLQMKGLEDAARCRSEADWIVGINGTRAMTAFNSQGGGFFLTTVGRVQTPTLSLVVQREEKILKHVARLYSEVTAEFKAEEGTYLGKWFDPKWKKGEDPEDKADRLWDTLIAVELIKDLTQKVTSDVTEESKTTSQASPFLFDLTSLQREANAKFGMSAKSTLATAQSLYEKHKVLTYPRTDSRFLPEDYVAVVKKTFEMFAGSSLSYLAPHAKTGLANSYIWPNKKIFNNAKVSDHFAIIPTMQLPGGLDEYERKIYDLVVKRFIAVFFPSAEFNVVTRITKVDGKHFKSEGKVLTKPGWLAIYGREAVAESDGDGILVPVKPGESVEVIATGIKEDHTKPAARYNEGTLLGAMESVGKQMEGESAKEAMKDKGLGTPATRAATIEGLLSESYLVRSGKEVVPTAKAFQLMTLLHGLDIEELTSAELTGGWEHRLSEMEKGSITREAFMNDISSMIRNIVDKASKSSPNDIKGDFHDLVTPCPSCGCKVVGKYKSYMCSKECGFKVPRILAGHLFSVEEVETLISTKEVGPISGLRTRMGKEFSSKVALKLDAATNNYTTAFSFEEKDRPVMDTDFSNKEQVGLCPCCKSPVYFFGSFYGCSKAVAPEGVTTTCKFKVFTPILKQDISVEQLTKLLNGDKTDILPGFISSKTNRPFKASLAWDTKLNRTMFVFEPRPEGKGSFKKGK